MAKIITNGAGNSLSGWIAQNATVVNNCFDIKNGYIKQMVGIDIPKRYRQYKLSYNCVDLRSRNSYFLFTVTRKALEKHTYFIPINFNEEQSLVFDIYDDITDLMFELVGNLTIKDINLSTYEGISESTSDSINEIKSTFDEITDGLGNVITAKMVGAIDSSVNNIINANSTIVIDGNNIMVRNASTDAAATLAMRFSSAGWMIANGKNADGTWNWRTAATGAGLVADVITTGKLSSIDLESVNILTSVLTGATIKGGRVEVGDDSTRRYVLIDSAGYPFGIYQKDSDGMFKSLVDLWANGDGGTLRIRDTEEYIQGQFRPIYTISSDGQGGVNIAARGNCEWTSQGDNRLSVGYKYVSFTNSNGATSNYGDFDVGGDLSVAGAKNAKVRTEHFGKRLLYCDESDRVYFSTKGIAETALASDEYKYILRIDDVFFETIEPNSICPYIINLTPYADARIWIANVYDRYIVIKSDKPCKFAYNLQATRKGYKDEYLREVE